MLKTSLFNLYIYPAFWAEERQPLIQNQLLGPYPFGITQRLESTQAIYRHLLTAFSTTRLSVQITNSGNANIYLKLLSLFVNLKNSCKLLL